MELTPLAHGTELYGGTGSFRRWVLAIAGNKILETIRHHLGSGKRSARREARGSSRPSSGAFPAPGPTPSQTVAAARTPDGSWAVVYSPRGGTVTPDASAFERPMAARWFDPRTGDFHDAGRIRGDSASFDAPSDEDWVLDLRPFDN